MGYDHSQLTSMSGFKFLVGYTHGGIFAITNISLRVGRLEAYSAISKDTSGIDKI